MWITRLAVSRPLAIIAIFAALAITGVVCYLTLPINPFPKVNSPVVTVSTVYAGAGSDEIELEITRPIEDAVAGLSDIDYITSSSVEGLSSVTVYFTDKADNNQIENDVQRAVNATIVNLPSDLTPPPTILKLDISQAPVMQLAVVSDSATPEDLYSAAVDNLEPALENVNGVSQVNIVGGQAPEVEVAVDPVRLSSYGVSLAQIQSALAAANASIPGGSISQNGLAYSLRVYALYSKPEDMGNIVIGGSGGNLVHLKDVATVTLGGKEQTQITRVNGRPGVLLQLGQQNGSNVTDVTDAVNAQLTQFQSLIPGNSQIVVVYDGSTFIRTALTNIRNELLIAVVLTSIVLLLFLHSVRVSAIVLVSIPTTLLTTFIAMQLMGFSLNFLSTLGLTLTIGILVDDSIVILENTLRRLSKGDRPMDAAINGRAEIGLAALAITLVDVVVFLPVGLVSGQVGAFFKEFGFTIAAATLTSLVVSFTLTPMLAARLLKPAQAVSAHSGLLHRFGALWDRGFARLERGYRRLLSWSLKLWPIVLVVAFGSMVLGLSLVVTGEVPTEFIPADDEGFYSVSTEAPPGTSLQAHDALMQQVEDRLLSMPYTKTVTASIGVSANNAFSGAASGGQARFGTVTVEVQPKSTGRPDVAVIAEDAHQLLSDIPGLIVRVQATGAGGGGQPVGVRVQGPDEQTLDQLGVQVQNLLEAEPGLQDVTNSAGVGQPELDISIDRGRADQLGISATAIGSAVRTGYSGVRATKFRRADGKDIDVNVELVGPVRDQLSSLLDLPLLASDGTTARLGQIANVTQTVNASEIDRRDRSGLVTIAANLAPGATLGAETKIVQQDLQTLQLPAGYTTALGGSSEQQNKSFGQLFTALGASILLSYLLMAVLYNSLTYPLAILFSLPVAVGGALGALFLFHYSFSLFAMIGMILLVGLAIKNGILLVDRTNQNRAAGLSRRDALLEAGPARLRPILMTSLTIAIALLPTALKLGDGAELSAPLAAAVLGGVVSSTALTLVVVPVMYTLLDALTHAMGGVGRLRRPIRPITRLTEKRAA